MQTRKEQKELRYQEILSVGLDLFIRKGYAATKIQDIANAAGMSTGLLFHYFKSKEDLYLSLIRLGVEGPKQMMRDVTFSNAIVFFETCAEQTLRYAQASMFTSKMFILMRDAAQDEGIPAEAKEIASKLNFYVETIPMIIKGQEEGTIKQGDPLSLSTLFWTTIQGIIQAYALNHQIQLPDGKCIVDIIRKNQGE